MRSTIVLIILSAACQLHSQINVDNRSFEPVDWFDTLYANCLSTGESQLSDLLHETYMGINNDLEKRKMYWEIEDKIWDLDLSEDLAQALAKNYISAISRDFILLDFAVKISQSVGDRQDLNLIRQIYTLDHYHDQLNYIDANYRKSNLSWNNYKKNFYLQLKEISVLLSDHFSEKDGALEDLNAAWTELNDLCEVMPVRLPSTPLDPGEFGAFYTHLKYYPDWDKKWRVGPDPDVVVRFPDDVHKFVFWRGNNYIPHWVTEKGFWFNNEFNETWFSEGSAEPMSDKQCRYSHVRIIESNDARVVIHWRYALNDVKYDIAWPDAYTGW
ncbi:MAG: hypothetical protein KAT15_25280, partial [Bacteroidales bacterium]|nr:hypothetical protein [Bacteroidales bacterium]